MSRKLTGCWQVSAAICFGIVVLLSGIRLDAQNTAVAQVSGIVTDASGAAVANAAVTMTETDKDSVHNTTSDASGQYVFPILPVGPYRLEVKANGFKDYVQSNIVLVVNQNIQINVAMQIGSISERIEVSAATSLVETKETSVSSVVNQQGISELPLNNRQATQLIITLGGAVYADSGDTGSKTPQYSTRIAIFGGQGNGTAYLLDGADATDAMSNVNLPFPFPDALQEFSIETSAVSSRFGEHPGATVNVVTKSGSNGFHGDLFDFIRNGDLDARNFFSTTGPDTLKRNQFGGVAGGRIIKDKLFFFGGFQGTRNRSNPPQSTTHVPTLAMLSGDFSTIAGPTCNSGKTIQLTNPVTKAPYPGNQIPVTSLDKVALGIMKYIPSAQANQCGLVTYGIPVTGDENDYIGRVDYVINEKHTLYGRYFAEHWQNPPVFDGTNLLTTTNPGNFELVQQATIGDTYTFGPGTLNSAHIGFIRVRDNRGPTNFPINLTDLGSNIYSAVPNFLLISSMTGGFTTYCGTCAPGHFNLNDFQGADDVDLIRGRHQIAFGVNLIRIQNNTVSGFDENGAPTFNGQFTGLGMADFLTGYMSDFQQTNATPDDLRQWEFSAYIQDSFKFRPNLTLNFGVRWEPMFADPDKFARGSSFGTAFNTSILPLTTVSTVHPTAPPGLFFPGDPGIPAANWSGHYQNFGPRVGVVWDPKGDGKQSIRAGGAILYDQQETWFNERETTNPPYGNDIDVGSTGTLTNPFAGYPGGNPFPQHGNLFFPLFGTYINMPLHPNPTYVAQWNVTYQRQFAGDWIANVAYVGNKTTHLWIAEERDPAEFLGTGPCTINGVNYNPCSSTANTNQRRLVYLANPTQGQYYASIDSMDDGAIARYQGLLLSVQHRFSHNFQMNINFTDSYCLSDYDFGAALAGSTNSQLFNRHADFGPCISDTRYNFNMTGVATSAFHVTNPVLNHIVNNWQIAPLLQARSGQPLNVTSGKDNSLTGLGNDRPVQVLANTAAVSPTCSSQAICVQFLNPAAFVQNAIGTYGDLGRNATRGPAFIDFDLALSRTFKLTERYGLQFRAEAFNLFNHANFIGAFAPSGQPAGASTSTLSTNLSSSNFGQVTGAYDPRILQFAMKFIF